MVCLSLESVCFLENVLNRVNRIRENDIVCFGDCRLSITAPYGHLMDLLFNPLDQNLEVS